MKSTDYITLTSLILAALVIGPEATVRSVANTGTDSTVSEYVNDTVEQESNYTIPTYQLHYIGVRDTVWVLGAVFIEISLKEQMAYLRFRDGRTIEYPVSTGTRYIEDGMETPTGLYTLQNKTKLAISRQFDDAKLHWWMGFNGNIGFHGLDGNSYYNHLGKRRSSHGCVRMSRHEIKELYQEVLVGTPVLVYDEPPARILAFGDSASLMDKGVQLLSKTKERKLMMNKRLDILYAGKLIVTQLDPVYLDGTTRLRPGGYSVGDAALIPTAHERPVMFVERNNANISDRFRAPGIRKYITSDDTLTVSL